MSDETIDLRDRVRRLEAENEDLRRDYRDLCALDAEGLRAKVVALTEENARERARSDEASADAVKAWEEASSLASQVRLLEFAANPVVVAGEAEHLRKERDAMGAHLRLALADVERLAGVSVAEVLSERRREIRDLTGRLNDALAAQERTAAELTQWQRATTFTVDPSRTEAERAFKARHDVLHAGAHPGSIGGRFTYLFCDTSIGYVVSLRCACGEKIDLTGDL